MTDTTPPSLARNIDPGHRSEPRESFPPALSGSVPLPTSRRNTSERGSSLPVDHGENAPSAPQDVADSALRHNSKLRRVTGYFVSFITTLSSAIWPTPALDEFVHVEIRLKLWIAAVVT